MIFGRHQLQGSCISCAVCNQRIKIISISSGMETTCFTVMNLFHESNSVLVIYSNSILFPPLHENLGCILSRINSTYLLNFLKTCIMDKLIFSLVVFSVWSRLMTHFQIQMVQRKLTLEKGKLQLAKYSISCLPLLASSSFQGV